MNTYHIHKEDFIKGVGYALGTFFLFTVMNTLAKLLNGVHHPVEIGFYRNLISALCIGAYIILTSQRHLFELKRPKMVIIRAIFGAISLITSFAAFQMLPMANAQIILFASVFIMPIVAFFVLDERVGIYRIAAIIAGFIGVILVCGPSATLSLIGVLMALAACISSSSVNVLLRLLRHHETPVTITFYFMLIGAMVTAVPMLWVAHMPTMQSFTILILCGVVGTLAQITLVSAYAHLQVALMGIFSYSSLIWATLFGWLFWSDLPTWQVWTGSVIIIASNLFILYRENRARKKNPAAPA